MAVKSKQKITLGTFDFMKGYAMMSIIVGHLMNLHNVGQSAVLTGLGYFLSVTSAGLIPLFFIISGFGFKAKNWKVMLKKSFSDLVVPYLLVTLSIAVLKPVVLFITTGSLYEAVTQTLATVICLLLGNTGERYAFGILMPWWLPSWYLLATFVSFNVLNLVMNLKKMIHQVLAVLCSMACGYLLFRLKFHLFCISQGMMAVSFCYLGCMIKKYSLMDKIRNRRWIYGVLILITAAEFFWGHFDLCPGDFNNVVLDFIGAGCSGLLLMLLGIWLGRIEWRIFEWIKQIGIYTYWLICIHTVEDNSLPWSMIPELLPNHQLLSFVIVIVMKIVLMAATCMALKRIAKYKYHRKMMRHGK